ncbi:mel-32 [Nucleospora cyclopteri]
MIYTSLEICDPEVDSIIRKEEERQARCLELIASENFASISVLQGNSCVLTNKYSEGQVGCRYYGGTENIDEMETLCKERALKVFNLDPEIWGVNVQVLSGSNANFAVYLGVMGKTGRIMGLDLPSGGHLTHGYKTKLRKISASSVFYESCSYRCRVNEETGYEGIDYDELEEKAAEFMPDILICGGSAYPRDFDYARLRKIAKDRYLMADISHISGFVATGLMKNAFEYADIVTTTTHKILRGPRSAMIFYRKTKVVDGETIDLQRKIDSAVFPALNGGPHNQKIAALCVALKQAMTEEYKKYCKQVIKNTQVLCEEFANMGFNVFTKGSDCHMLLLSVDGLTGDEMQSVFDQVDVSINKNCLPTDTRPLKPSAIRIGTPAMTTRGAKEEDFKMIAILMEKTIKTGIRLKNKGEENFIDEIQKSEELKSIKKEVNDFVSQFPIPCFNFRSNK